MTPKIKSQQALSVLGAISAGSISFGVGFGVVKSAHLSLVGNILSLGAVLAILFFIFRAGKGKAYSDAQAWAQSEVDVAVSVLTQATLTADLRAEAYAVALSNASAVATQHLTVNMKDEQLKLSRFDREIMGARDDVRDAERRVSIAAEVDEVAMGERTP